MQHQQEGYEEPEPNGHPDSARLFTKKGRNPRTNKPPPTWSQRHLLRLRSLIHRNSSLSLETRYCLHPSTSLVSFDVLGPPHLWVLGTFPFHTLFSPALTRSKYFSTDMAHSGKVAAPVSLTPRVWTFLLDSDILCLASGVFGRPVSLS